jgi:hypothetical protein
VEELPQSNPLRQLVTTWVKKLKAAEEYKKPFSDDAKEASNFFDGDHNWMWKDAYARGERGYNNSIAPPSFRMQLNKVFEAVSIIGSVIYHRNPVRTVTVQEHPEIPLEELGIDGPSGPGDEATPMQQQMADIVMSEEREAASRKTVAKMIESYLSWTPVELDLKRHAKRVVNEALIKGMGVFWTELVSIENSATDISPPMKMVGSFYDSVDNLLLDPDWDNIDDIRWCARKCVQPLQEVADTYGIPPADLQKHIDGGTGKLSREPKGKKKIENTNQLVTFYKIWSKTGAGDRFKDAPKESKGVFDNLGKYVYLVVCEGVNYPLNLPPSVLDAEVDEELGMPPEVLARASWPIPFHADPNGWPFTPLAFHYKPGYTWPISHIRPAIGELRLLNWCFSFLATRIATSCETMVAVTKAADQDIKDQILAPSEGGFKIIELSELLGRRVEDIISVFQFPQVTKDLWDIISAIMDQFAQRTGLTELLHGYTRSMFRSAAEAQIKQENISVRPDEMANELENTMSLLSRREALAARWLLEPHDVAPIIGNTGATFWARKIMSMDISQLTRDFLYRVEAGSARKPNKATRVEQMQMAVQTMAPILSQLAGAGVVQPFNALMRDWAASLDIDAEPYLLPPPAPPAPPGMPPPSPPPAPPSGDAGAEGAVAPLSEMLPGLPPPPPAVPDELNPPA